MAHISLMAIVSTGLQSVGRKLEPAAGAVTSPLNCTGAFPSAGQMEWPVLKCRRQ
jgi:hypothetical protein